MSTPSILVVEDNEEQARVFAEWLGNRYDVTTVHTVEDAADAIDAAIDVVLLDRDLSGDSNGDDLLESFREAGYSGQVAMVTAQEPDFDIIELGVDDYLQKPVSAADLQEVVQRLLSRRLYDDKVRRYYELSAKRAALESEKDERVLERNDEYARLCSELAALEDLLSDLVADLGEDEFLQEFRDLKSLAETNSRADDRTRAGGADHRQDEVDDRNDEDHERI